MEEKVYYARSFPRDKPTRWQLLEDHLNNVAERAAVNARPFDSFTVAQLAGYVHDLGKYRPAFQDKIRNQSSDKVKHAVVGAMFLLRETQSFVAEALAQIVLRHHGGLYNASWSNQYTRSKAERTFVKTMSAAESKTLLEEAAVGFGFVPEEFSPFSELPLPYWIDELKNKTGLEYSERQCIEFWIRLLFSCLVDADALDAEKFETANKAAIRDITWPALDKLLNRLKLYVSKFPKTESEVNKVRREIQQDCIRASMRNPGVYSLTAPTGAGKTIASILFALEHAVRHNLRRVIIAIPYTTIAEQTASTLKKALGSDVVVEHHSEYDSWLDKKEGQRKKLVAENWDAPIIITTNVQLFESLFSHKPSKCRKLHNIVNSVIILDEAQTLPVSFVEPVLSGLKELSTNYGCTVLLSTATQPAFKKSASLPNGFDRITEVVRNVSSVYKRLRRVRVSWKYCQNQMQWEDIAEKVKQHKQALVIVHKRQDARDLYNLLPSEYTYHLSARMCPLHRKDTFKKIRKRLEEGKRCLVVSTQLVEAGVDIDFPVVYRALAGVDSLAQAAGRCNREGLLKFGKFFIFRGPTEPPNGYLRWAKEITEELLFDKTRLDIFSRNLYKKFFRRLYLRMDQDERNIQALRAALAFEEVGNQMKFIDNGSYTMPVVVPYADSAVMVARVRQAIEDEEEPRKIRGMMRSLNPYTVTIYTNNYNDIIGAVATISSDYNFHCLEVPPGVYDNRFGLGMLSDTLFSF